MSRNDPDWDGYRNAFGPQRQDKWKNLAGVSMTFEHPATPHMRLDQPNLLREELDRKEIGRPNRGWVCLLFIYRERKSTTRPWGPPKFSFQKFRKRHGFWWRYSVVNLPIDAIAEAYDFLGKALEFDESDEGDDEQDAA